MTLMNHPDHRSRGGRVSVLGGAGLFALARFGSALSGALVTVVVSRSLGPENFGVFALALNVATIGAALSDAGLNSLIMRESIANPHHEKSLLRWGIATRFVLGLLVCTASALVLWILLQSWNSWISAVFVVSTLPLISVSIWINALNRKYLFGRVALTSVVQTVSWLVTSLIAAALFKHSLFAYAVAYFIAMMVYALSCVILSRAAVPTEGSKLPLKSGLKLLLPAIPLGIGSIFTMLYSKASAIVVFAMEGAAASGQYALAGRLLDQLAIIPMTIAMVFAPAINYAIRDNVGVSEIVARWARINCTAAVFVACVLFVTAPTLIGAVFGSNYVLAVPIFRWFCVAFVFICIGWMLTPLAIAFRMVSTQLCAASLGLITTASIAWLLTRLLGANGAAMATVITEVVVVSVLIAWLRFRRDLRVIHLSLICKVGSLAIVVLGLGFLPHTPEYVRYVLCVVGGVIVAMSLRLIQPSDLSLPEISERGKTRS